MKRTISGLGILAVLMTVTSPSWADNIFSTDRFGYTGMVTRYDTLSDAQTNSNALDSFSVEDVAGDDSREHRDVSIFVADGSGADGIYVLGSWWYTTSTNGAGWGNINGNTGIGFMQLFDDDSSTDTSLDMGFEAFDGTYWTEYYMRVEGGNATAADDSARFSAYNNVNDAGTYIDYVLDIRATGLEGTDSGGGVIVANNHPTGVSGTFSALFSFGGDPDGYPDDKGPAAGWGDDFYRVELTFDTENWAFSQNGSLQGPYHENNEIYASYFEGTERVPEPGTTALLALGLVGIGLSRRKIVV